MPENVAFLENATEIEIRCNGTIVVHYMPVGDMPTETPFSINEIKIKESCIQPEDSYISLIRDGANFVMPLPPGSAVRILRDRMVAIVIPGGVE